MRYSRSGGQENLEAMKQGKKWAFSLALAHHRGRILLSEAELTKFIIRKFAYPGVGRNAGIDQFSDGASFWRVDLCYCKARCRV